MKIEYLKTKEQKKETKINSNIIIITGPNGVGKSRYLESLANPNTSRIVLNEYANLKTENLNIYIKGNTFSSFKEIIWNENTPKDMTFNALLKRGFNSRQTQQGTSRHSLIMSSTSKIINLNDELKKHEDDKYNDLNKRFVQYFISLARSAFKDTSQGKAFIARQDDSPILRMKWTLEQFLEGKEVVGLDAKGKNILIKDLDGQDKTLDNLSSGEKKIFALASIFLESTMRESIFLWDEPENSLHPKWQKNILSFLSKYSKDAVFILVSHSQMIVMQSSISEDVDLLTFNRDQNGVKLSHSDLYDDVNLKDVMGIDIDFIDIVRNTSSPTIFVEGKTDVKYLSQLSSEYKIIGMNGQGNYKHIINSIPILDTIHKDVLFVFDNDVNGIEHKEKSINLPGLGKDETIEKYFIDILPDAIDGIPVIKSPEFNDEEVANYYPNVKKDRRRGKALDQINKTGFAYSDSSMIDEGRGVITKTMMCEYLTTNIVYKEKILPLVKKIKEHFNT